MSAEVLIVDDLAANRLLLQDLCESLGLAPALAENGREAIEKMRAAMPDVVLLDIVMPEMDGYAVLDEMKSDSELKDIPVIMISAVDELQSVVRCIKAGAEDYLVKPFEPALLKARLGSCLERKWLRDQEQKLHAELKASYTTLREAEAARDMLSHMIVHDLNNPLTSILGYSQMLSGSMVNEDRVKRYAGQIHTSGQEMVSLIRGILDVSRLDAGEMPIRMTTVNVAELARTACEQLAIQAKSHEVQLKLMSCEEVVEARADRDLLGRVLANLISNALKHTKRGTRVEVSVRCADDGVLLEVTDDGEGILPEYRDKIFDKYFQVEARKSGKKYGTGLGLAFCKLAAEAQDGRIWVEEAAGGGSCFLVQLKDA